MVKVSQVADYVGEVFGTTPQIVEGVHLSLPPIFQHHYNFAEMFLKGKRLLLLIAKPNRELTPKQIIAHTVKQQPGGFDDVVYVAQSITTYTRHELVRNQVSFIVPHSQLSLPPMAFAFRDRAALMKQRKEKIGVVAQVLVLAELLKRDVRGRTATDLAAQFGYTKVSLGRAIEELQNHELIHVSEFGRRKEIEFVARGFELWSRARELLQSPVKKRIYLSEFEPREAFEAGMTALSRRTEIVESYRKTYAISAKAWKDFEEKSPYKLRVHKESEGVPFEVEIWRYDPSLFADGRTVDTYSLILSLEKMADERVEIALNNLTEGLK